MIGLPVLLQDQMIKPFSRLPDCVLVEGKNYNINTDFRTWAELYSFMESSATYEQKILKLLLDGYTNELPPHLDSAVKALLDFMVQGNNTKHNHSESSDKIISFSHDEGAIYASFLSQYGINLFTENLHWWSFMHLLNSLDVNTAFMKIVTYRTVNCQSIKNKEMRKFYRKMKNKYRITNNMNDGEIASVLDSVMQ